jgi:ABC-type nitrate/sulfonate/bicarbonate transport system ATPase subunit
MAENMLTVVNLTKRFGENTVIENLSFTVARSSRLTISAPSSAGKSTLINILAGLDRDYQGRFALQAERAATIFQEPRLFPYMTVEENIFLPAKLHGAARAGVRTDGRPAEWQRTAAPHKPVRTGEMPAYEGWLEACELGGYRRHYPYQLSGGMKQKVALIRGFLYEPDFVLMDEPFKSIDARAKQAIIRHILDNYPRVTLLFVTHALDEIPLLAQSLLLFKTNRLADYLVQEVHDLGGRAPI